MATSEHPLKHRIHDRLSPEHLARLEARIALRKEQAFDRQMRREWDRREREISRQFNDDHPGGCERCGEAFGVENAEVVDPTGNHLIIHVSCITDTDRMA